MEISKINEKNTGHAKSMKLKSLIEISKSICKIQKYDSFGTGFFTSLNDKGHLFLVTAFHVIPYPMIEKKKTIEIICDAENIKREIILDPKQRKYFYSSKKDITIIEIIVQDHLIDKVKSLELDINCKLSTYGDYLNKDIFIMHHPKGEDLECNSGKIVMIKEPNIYEFQHTLDTMEGSSGSPILLFEKQNEKPKVIGIHTSACIGNKNNIGVFIDALNNILETKIEKEYIKELNVPSNTIVEIPENVEANCNRFYIAKDGKLVVKGRLIFGAKDP